MTAACVHCGATGFLCENKGNKEHIHFGAICCNKGKVNPAPWPDLPPFFFQLYTSPEPICKYFHNNIRKINAAFSMVSQCFTDATY